MAGALSWLGGFVIGVGNGVAREATVARRRWPLKSRDEALKIGGAWLARPDLLADYNLAKVSPLADRLAWNAIGPEQTRRKASR